MASAEKLLNEAQYAFANISFDGSRSNTRNASRARGLCRKIIRRFPGSTEAYEAHSILRRLGEEAFTSNLNVRHSHKSQADHHRPVSPPTRSRGPERQRQTTITSMEDVVALDWGAVLRWLLTRPLSILVTVGFVALVLFGIFGPFLVIPLVALVLFTGPLRKMLNLEQRDSLDALVKRVNAYVGADS